jgi:hypothetical protein
MTEATGQSSSPGEPAPAFGSGRAVGSAEPLRRAEARETNGAHEQGRASCGGHR